ARMEIDRRTQQAERHRRALDVPAGTAGAEPGVPHRLARLARLPQHEIAGVVLLVLVTVDARAALDPRVIEPRETAVLGKRRDLEVDRSVALIRVPPLLERHDRLGHRRDVLAVGSPRLLL